MKKAVNTPVIMQMEALECGAAALSMVMAYHGRWVPLERVREDLGVSRDGAKASSIVKVARRNGFVARGFRYEVEDLKTKVSYPCILHWEFNHFVVLNGFHGDRAVLNDPALGRVEVDAEELDEAFTGICLTFEPSEGFEKTGAPVSVARFVAQRLKNMALPVVIVALACVAGGFADVLAPVFSRVFLDRILTGLNSGWLRGFLLLLSGVLALRLLAMGANALFMVKVQGRMAIAGGTSFMWHVLRLPMRFFAQRLAGDIAQRQISNDAVAKTLVGQLAPIAINFALLILYVAVMARYSWLLTLIVLLGTGVNVLLARAITRRRLNIARVQARDEGKLYGITTAGIEMMDTIKASGAELGFFERWSGTQAAANAAEARYRKTNGYWGLIPDFVDKLVFGCALFLGAVLMLRGDMTAGVFLAFQGFITLFLQPARMLIEVAQQFQEMRTSIERIDDVMRTQPDIDYPPLTGAEGFDKLRGGIELRGVTFGYSPLAAPLIRDFSLRIAPGERVAFVGMSGSGKSTLSSLICGLYAPWEGDILFDGMPLADIPREVFVSSIAVVDQDIVLFEDTVANNIKMWDDSTEDFEMILAARDAQIHSDILSREDGYAGPVQEMGRNFSGGQRQQLEIARVLAKDPHIVILDEATSALDAVTEHRVVRSINDRGITTVVISHRLSTIRDADKIVVLDKGVAVEVGTHDELMARGGLYTQLVTAQ